MEIEKQYTWWLKAISGADEVQARRFAGAIALEIGWWNFKSGRTDWYVPFNHR